MKFTAGTDNSEPLGEHVVAGLPQCGLHHGARIEEQPRNDPRARQPTASEPRDLPLPRSQLIASLDRRVRTVSPVASSSPRARSANASAPMSRNSRTNRPCAIAWPRSPAHPSRAGFRHLGADVVSQLAARSVPG